VKFKKQQYLVLVFRLLRSPLVSTVCHAMLVPPAEPWSHPRPPRDSMPVAKCVWCSDAKNSVFVIPAVCGRSCERWIGAGGLPQPALPRYVEIHSPGTSRSMNAGQNWHQSWHQVCSPADLENTLKQQQLDTHLRDGCRTRFA
jgi:hypothetical protein